MSGDEIKSIRIEKVVRPLRTTFSTSLGRKDHMQSIIVRATLRDGSTGIGECATSFSLPHESLDAIKGIIMEERPRLTGRKAAALSAIIPALRKKYPRYPMTISGLEIALFRAWLHNTGKEERAWFGGALRQIATDITIPFATDMGVLDAWMAYAGRQGFTDYKVKVSGNTADDRRLISHVASILSRRPGTFVLRLDGNQGFTSRSYLSLVEFIEKRNLPVELFEQPLKKNDHRGLKEVAKRSSIPVILDETVFTARDMELSIEKGLGHGVNIKTAKSGIGESRTILDLAIKHSFKLMIGCMTETMTGLSAGINLAMGSGSFDYIDLDSIFFLDHKKTYGTLEIKGPTFRYRGRLQAGNRQ